MVSLKKQIIIYQQLFYIGIMSVYSDSILTMHIGELKEHSRQNEYTMLCLVPTPEGVVYDTNLALCVTQLSLTLTNIQLVPSLFPLTRDVGGQFGCHHRYETVHKHLVLNSGV